MVYENSVNSLNISRLMFKYPWLEYPERNKEIKKAMAPVHLPLSCYQLPKEELPPSPECWRQHPSKPNAVPYCYFKKPEIYTHWHTLYDQQEEREAQKALRKMRDHPRYLKEGTRFQKLHPPVSKLTTESQKGPRPLQPTSNQMKWQRLKELTQSLKSPREDKQRYAAQALGCLRTSDTFVVEALLEVAKTGPEEVKYEACRTLAILGCLNEHVIQSLINQLKGQNEGRRMETLMGLRVALNSWVAVPKDKRTQIGYERKLVSVLQMLTKKLSDDAALEAALCLGFLKPCSKTVQEFLLQCLCQGPKTRWMKALRMLVKLMHVHSAAVIRAILDQLCYSNVLEHRLEATQMLRTIGLEQIQVQGLEGLTFDLLRKKMHNEPFLAMRQAVAETVEKLKMKPLMMNLVEAQLMDPNVTARQEAVISLGVLGVRSPQVFHLLLDMLDAETNQAVKKSLQETLILLASIDPWIKKKLENKVIVVYEGPKANENPEYTRFQKEPESPEELKIQDFKLVQLSPLFTSKSSTKVNQQKTFTTAFASCFSNPLKNKSQAIRPWKQRIKRHLQTFAETSK
ncbi:protein HEATR9 [Choloepus didactylus]|uniref:protein HEATR9 n=1 Tax=Choloepus didactylus TaxID=27675 RepID=UPI00189CA6AA|nr:protein HEATR9 [Choloepus didactylus]